MAKVKANKPKKRKIPKTPPANMIQSSGGMPGQGAMIGGVVGAGAGALASLIPGAAPFAPQLITGLAGTGAAFGGAADQAQIDEQNARALAESAAQDKAFALLMMENAEARRDYEFDVGQKAQAAAQINNKIPRLENQTRVSRYTKGR
jgi:hypothetical protein